MEAGTALMKSLLQADGKARDAGLKRQDGHYINDQPRDGWF